LPGAILVDTGHVTKVIANATSGWLHFGFLAGLMIGTQPDGSTGHPEISPMGIRTVVTSRTPLIRLKDLHLIAAIGANGYELVDYPNDAFGVMTSGSAKKSTMRP
jgi:hypothetical protein